MAQPTPVASDLVRNVCTDTDYMTLITGVEYEPPQNIRTRIFNISVHAKWFIDCVLDVWKKPSGVICGEWQKTHYDAMRGLFAHNEQMPSTMAFIPIAHTNNNIINEAKSNATLHLQCQARTYGCKTSYRLDVSLFELFHQDAISLQFMLTSAAYHCHQHPMGTLSGHVSHPFRAQLGKAPPRLSQIAALSSEDYDPHTTYRQNIPSANAMAQIRHEHNVKQYLDPDLFVSLLKMQEIDKKNPYFEKIAPPYNMNVHSLTRYHFGFAVYNDIDVRIGIKFGGDRTRGLTIDSSEGVVADIYGKRAISMYIWAPSPAKKEIYPIFQYHTNLRESAAWKAAFVQICQIDIRLLFAVFQIFLQVIEWCGLQKVFYWNSGRNCDSRGMRYHSVCPRCFSGA
eukprot:1111167_1